MRKDIAGVGVGLRNPHYEFIETRKPAIPWFEVLVDNYFGGGSALEHLHTVRENYPVTFHSVGMSLGGSDMIDISYLSKLKELITRFEPQHISDHICWTKIHDMCFHELLPLPYTLKTVGHVARRILQVQDFIGQRILIENVSSYLSYKHSEMSEWEFVNELALQADCDILLDVNNVYVSAYNHGFDANAYIDAMPTERIKEIHLAGYEEQGEFLLDTHSEKVHKPVWRLYKYTLRQHGVVPTLIEWDNALPEFPVLEKQAAIAQGYINNSEDVSRSENVMECAHVCT